jgi:hypothetical protein
VSASFVDQLAQHGEAPALVTESGVLAYRELDARVRGLADRLGASIVLTDLSVVDPCFWALFERVGATSFAGVPHTFDLLDRVGFEAMALPTLRYVTQAGGRMSPELIRRHADLGAARGWQLFVMYGQTEATARMGYLPPELAATHPHTIGNAIPGGTFTIEEPDDRGVGELVYRGANVMLGYAERPEDLALGRTVDALRTGDLARWTGEGLVEIVGRRSRFIKPFGLRVDLDHLETHLAADGIAALCTGDDSCLVVAVDGAANSDRAAAVIERHLHLPRSRVAVVQLDELPRLANGKPDYAAVAAARRAGTEQTPGTPLDDVAAAFSGVLGVDASPDDTFAGLGGDSLSYVEMSIVLEELLGELPRDWHLRPLRELTARRPRRRLARVETSVVVRCVATVLIVGNHTGLWHQTGGAHALLGVAGYNFARFQLDGAKRWTSIARVAVPSMCWMGLLAATADGFSWRNALLVNGLIGTPHDRWAYWFIEALVYILAALTALFAIPIVARFERRRPFNAAAAVVAVGLMFRFDLIDFATSHRIWRPHEVLWIFALGWAAARAETLGRQLVVVAVAAVSVAGFFGNTGRELIVLLAITLIVWVRAAPLPRFLVGAVGLVASASLYIYLVQFQVYPPVGRISGPLAATVMSLVAGVAAWTAARRATAAGRSLLRGLWRASRSGSDAHRTGS